jgi:hypothetical protein
MIMPRPRDDGGTRALGIESLKNVPLFRDFDETELSEVAQLVTTRRYGKHQTIFVRATPVRRST